jgi:hypothetical protein
LASGRPLFISPALRKRCQDSLVRVPLAGSAGFCFDGDVIAATSRKFCENWIELSKHLGNQTSTRTAWRNSSEASGGGYPPDVNPYLRAFATCSCLTLKAQILPLHSKAGGLPSWFPSPTSSTVTLLRWCHAMRDVVISLPQSFQAWGMAVASIIISALMVSLAYSLSVIYRGSSRG